MAGSCLDSILCAIPSRHSGDNPAVDRSRLSDREKHRASDVRRAIRATLLGIGITANIAFLGYFKYWNFFLDTSNLLLATHFSFEQLILPLGISFITFQKIAYLMDVYLGQAKSGSFLDFLLFTLFFPRVIAGPIVHYQEIMPQLSSPTFRWVSTDFAVAICLFSIGLFKKVVIADGLADYAAPVFAAPLQGEPVTLLSGWIGALAYTFQIYFDFSGYSDMALGVARIFGVVLPMNFEFPPESPQHRGILEPLAHNAHTLSDNVYLHATAAASDSPADSAREAHFARAPRQSVDHSHVDRIANRLDDDDFGILAWSRISVHRLGHSPWLDADRQPGVANLATTILA